VSRLFDRIPAWAITAALAVVYLILAPPSPDLAAADYRSHLFSQVGFSLWDNSWYGGHHLPAYSLLAPALGSLIGTQPVAAISMVVSTWLFALAIAGHFPPRLTRIAAVWFAVGASVGLLSSRVPFDLGLAIGLGAIVLAQRRLFAAALLLTVLSTLASPVAGAFLALAMLAWALSVRKLGWPVALCVLALAPVALLSIAFPEGGSQPFVASAFYPAVAAVIVIGLATPVDQRMLRLGALLYALALTGSYLLATPVGGNVDRLGALMAGPIAACALGAGALRDRRVWLLIGMAPLLLYWQANAPVADYAAAASDEAVHPSYYRPLIDELQALDVGYGATPRRIEVVPDASHWEARWVAPHVMLARGWERQLDRYRNGVFYERRGPLTATSYASWLQREAVAYVALPDAPLDYSAKAEAALLRSGSVRGLREIWHSAHWRLFAVEEPAPLAETPALLTEATSEAFEVQIPRPGDYLVRIRFTPYWALQGVPGCVSQGPEDWTLLHADGPGHAHVEINFSLARIFSTGARCN
jgi:hypothetical protein